MLHKDAHSDLCEECYGKIEVYGTGVGRGGETGNPWIWLRLGREFEWLLSKSSEWRCWCWCRYNKCEGSCRRQNAGALHYLNSWQVSCTFHIRCPWSRDASLFPSTGITGWFQYWTPWKLSMRLHRRRHPINSPSPQLELIPPCGIWRIWKERNPVMAPFRQWPDGICHWVSSKPLAW